MRFIIIKGTLNIDILISGHTHEANV